jgi:hypothetical protein
LSHITNQTLQPHFAGSDMLSLRSFEERLNSNNMHVSSCVAGFHLLVLPLSL